MPITPSTQIVIPAIESKTADKYWITNLNIQAPSVSNKIALNCTLVPYNSTTGEMFRNLSKRFTMPDVFEVASTDPAVAATIEALFAQIDRLAKADGLI
jgi:hypothetical protein